MQNQPAPHSEDHRQQSRRNFLIGFGMTGLAGAGLACGGASVLLLALLNREPEEAAPQEQLPTAVVVPENIPEVAEIPAPPIIPKAEWGGLPVNWNARYEKGAFDAEDNPTGYRIYDEPLADVYRTVILHHAAYYENDDISTLRSVQNLHRGRRGWADVGYHYLVGKSGAIYEGRSIGARGAHTAGHNHGSAGICLLGNFEEETITQAQYESVLQMILWLTQTLQLTHLAGHKSFNPITACPGKDTIQYFPEFAAAANLSIGTEGYQPPDDSVKYSERQIVGEISHGCACGQHI